MRVTINIAGCVALGCVCSAVACSSKSNNPGMGSSADMISSATAGTLATNTGGSVAGSAGSGGANTSATAGTTASTMTSTAGKGTAGATSSTAGASGSAAGMTGSDAGMAGSAAGTMASAAGATGSAGAAGAETSAPACMASTPTMLSPGDHTSLMLTHDGKMRQYNVHVPASYDGTKSVPLILDFHGWTSSGTEEEGGGSDMMGSGWKAKSESVGFIVVYPNGLDASWNGGALCCGTSQSNKVDDEGFARDIVAKMEMDACIDPKRVYVTGISNGGAMSHLLACKDADLFAAAAPVSMGNGTTPCNPSRPISVVMFRGKMDTSVPYDGGTFPSAMADFDMWKSANGCTGTPMMNHQYCQTYTQCKAGVVVTLCSLPKATHIVYEDKAEIVVADVAWETFSTQTLP